MKSTDFDLIVKSPGRINFIGEHTDYNGGHVLPAAINLGIEIGFRRKKGTVCYFNSKAIDAFSIDLRKPLLQKKDYWGNYVLGVLDQILKIRPKLISGFDCQIESNLPIGSGISSSAALECGVAFGLNELFNLNLSEIDIIEIAQKAEHNFVGTKCGIMDPFVIIKGVKGKIILLNCETLKYNLIESNFESYKVILLNTNVSHNLASSEYNLRRIECKKALNIVRSHHYQYKNLAEVPLEVIIDLKTKFDKITFKRASYVAEEEARTKKASKAINLGNIKKLGELMYKSHKGLSKKYQVSCEELDFLVDCSKEHDSVVGSRMMGGGFGGCTINLIQKDNVQTYINFIKDEYYKKFNVNLSAIEVNVSDGVRKLH